MAKRKRIFESNLRNTNAMHAAMGGREFPNVHDIFFKPDYDFVDWMIEYANDRLIVEVGPGSCHFLNILKAKGYERLLGIEPSFDFPLYASICMNRNQRPLHILAMEVEHCKGVLAGFEEKALIVLARPSHSGMVEATLDVMHEDQELLYITKPENWERYDDLGKYREKAVKLSHEGKGSENEEVWSVNLK